MPSSAALSCLGPWSVWRSGLASCIGALYIDVLFIPYSLAGAAEQGLAAGCFHPRALLCLWLQSPLSRPLKALLSLCAGIKQYTPEWGSTARALRCCAHPLLCCLPRSRQALEGWWPGQEALFLLGQVCPWFGNSDGDLRSLAVLFLPPKR